MKTTSKNAATKRLLALTSKENRFPVSKSSIAYKLVLQVIEGEKILRPVYTSGSGRFTSTHDHTFDTKNILTKIGIEFTISNDSPKGGIKGNLITILTKIK